MKQDNITVVTEKIKSIGYEVGIIDNNLKALTKKTIKEVVDSIGYGSTDVFIEVRKNLYVVEIAECDEEIDIIVYAAERYFSQYGNLEDCYDNGDITEEQYNKYKNLV